MDPEAQLPGQTQSVRQDRAAGPGRPLEQAGLGLGQTYQVVAPVGGRPQHHLGLAGCQHFPGLRDQRPREVGDVAAPEHHGAETRGKAPGEGPGHAFSQIRPLLGKEVRARRRQAGKKDLSPGGTEGHGQAHFRYAGHFFQDIFKKAVIKLCSLFGGQGGAETGFHLSRARFLGKYDEQGGHVVSDDRGRLVKGTSRFPGLTSHSPGGPGQGAEIPDAAALSPKPAISLILPVLNEAAMLAGVLANLPRTPALEILLVDGGSTDATRNVAAGFPHVRWLSAARGRGAQMNVGARVARGDFFVFLHSDTVLTADHLAALGRAVLDPRVGAGAFELRLIPPTPFLRFIAWGANWRSRLFRLPYGDQALFVRRDLFFALGGYSQRRPEDLDLVIRLRRLTRLRLLRPPVATSGRRWLQQGNLRTSGCHWLYLILHLAERLCTRRWPRMGQLYPREGDPGPAAPALTKNSPNP
jgi:rSAM/selenodomain-associated transferase 2